MSEMGVGAWEYRSGTIKVRSSRSKRSKRVRPGLRICVLPDQRIELLKRLEQCLYSITPALQSLPRLGVALARRPYLAGAPGDKCFHSARRAVGCELFLEDLVDFAVFVGVFDLPAALLHAPVGVLPASAAGRVE